ALLRESALSGGWPFALALARRRYADESAPVRVPPLALSPQPGPSGRPLRPDTTGWRFPAGRENMRSCLGGFHACLRPSRDLGLWRSRSASRRGPAALVGRSPARVLARALGLRREPA